MDIAVATGATVKLVNSAGTSTPVLSATPLPLTDAILGDFDGDGLTDLLATQADRLFAVGDLWSTPATPSQHLWLTTSTDRQLRVGDIDGRGADFVVSPTTSALEVLVLTTGSGSPSFSSIASGAPLQWKSASFVDINQDDLLDLLVIEDSSRQIKLVAFVLK